MATSGLSRACTTFGFTGLLVIAVAGSASAHVSADAPGAAQGDEAVVVTFRVPNESTTATTTGLTVTLPVGSAPLSVRSAPITGWSTTVAKAPNGVATSITWTAKAGTSIGPDQFGQFALEVGPLPKTDTLSFPTTQNYSDGTVVRWDQPPHADGSESEHPIPTVALAASDPAAMSGMPGMSGTPKTPGAAAPNTAAVTLAAAGSPDTTARWLGGVALLLGALGLGLGVGATMRTRRRTP